MSLPSPPVTSPFLNPPIPYLSLPSFFPSQPKPILLHFEGEGTLLVVFKMHGFKQQSTAFPYIFMKKFPKS